jgi:tetratricopeptide (TPR) repeat protein
MATKVKEFDLDLGSEDLPEAAATPQTTGSAAAPLADGEEPLLELPDEAMATSSEPDDFSVGSTDIPPPPELPKVDAITAGLVDALEHNDFPRALDAFRAGRHAGKYPDLEPRHELRLATFLDNVGEADEAVKACQRAFKTDPKGPFAARAIYTAARLTFEKLRDKPKAVALYGFFLKQFPTDELAVRAETELRRIR